MNTKFLHLFGAPIIGLIGLLTSGATYGDVECLGACVEEPVRVGTDGTGDGTLSITNNELFETQTVSIIGGGGNNGTLNIDDTSTFTARSVAGDTRISRVLIGLRGGVGPGAPVGTVNVNGGTLEVLDVDPADAISQGIQVGFGGTGVLNVNSGGLVSVEANGFTGQDENIPFLTIGSTSFDPAGSFGEGTANVDGEGSSVQLRGNGALAALSVGFELGSGVSPSGDPGQSLGRLNVTNGADVLVDGGFGAGFGQFGRGDSSSEVLVDGVGSSVNITGGFGLVLMGTDLGGSFAEADSRNEVVVSRGASFNVGNGLPGSGSMVIGDGVGANDFIVTTGGSLNVDGVIEVSRVGSSGSNEQDGFLIVGGAELGGGFEGSVTAQNIVVGDGVNSWTPVFDGELFEKVVVEGSDNRANGGLINGGTVFSDVTVQTGGFIFLGEVGEDALGRPAAVPTSSGLIVGDVTMTDGLLFGNGAITGMLDVQGGVVDFGFSPGAIQFGSLQAGAGAEFRVELVLNPDGSINVALSDQFIATDESGSGISFGEAGSLANIVFEFLAPDAGPSVTEILSTTTNLDLLSIFQVAGSANTPGLDDFQKSFAIKSFDDEGNAIVEQVRASEFVAIAAAVPEPGTLGLMLAGLGAVFIGRRRRQVA